MGSSSSSSAPASRGRLKKDIDKGEMGKVLSGGSGRPGPTTLHCHSTRPSAAHPPGLKPGVAVLSSKYYERYKVTDTVYGGGADRVGRLGKRRIS